MSKYDRVKLMSVEEMAGFLFEFFINYHNEEIVCNNHQCPEPSYKNCCYDCIIDWLKEDKQAEQAKEGEK